LGQAGKAPGSAIRRVIVFSSAAVMMSGALGLVGWIAGIRSLAGIRSEYVPISPDTALALLVLGLLLFFGTREQIRGAGRPLVLGVIAFVSLYGFLKFVEYLVDIDLTFGTILFPATETVGSFLVKRMSPVTGALLFLSGIALQLQLFLSHRSGTLYLTGAVGLVNVIVGFVATLGYVFGTPLLYGGDVIPLAATTAIGFLFLGCGLLAAAGPESIFVRFITGGSASARQLRVILPIIVSAMLVQGYVEVSIIRVLDVNPVLATALLTIIFIVLTGVMVARSSQSIFRRADEAEADRKRAEANERLALEFRSNIVDSAIDMIIAVDLDRNIIEFNRAAEEAFGYRKHEMLGRHADILYADPDEGRKINRTVMEQGRIVQEILTKRRNGEVFPSILSASVLRDGRGNVIGVMGTFRDITERKLAAQSIADAANFNSTMLEASPVGIIAYKSTGEVISMNQAAATIVGGTREQLSAQNWRKIDSWKKYGLFDAARSALEENHEKQLETLMMTTFGNERWLSCRFVPFLARSEQHLLLLFADVTEQKKAEELSRNLYQAIERTEEIIFMTDTKGVITYVNPAFEKVYGYREEDIVGKTTPRVLKSNLMGKEFYEDFWKILQARKNFRGEMLNRTKDGRVVRIEASTAPVVDDRQALVGFLSVQKDITEQKTAEEALRTAEERYRTLFEQSPDGIVVIDPETLHPLQFNERAHKQLGYSREEFAGLNVADFEVLEKPEVVRARAEKIMREGRDTFESKHRTKQGEIRDVDVNILRITLHDKPVFYSIFRDITAQKRLEAQLLRNQRMESIGTLAGGIAHDLNNVLGPILLSLDVMRQKVQDRPLRRMIDTVESSARRGAELIKQVLSFARGIEGKRGAIQVRHLVNEIGQIIKETFPKSITLRTKAPKDLWTISGDATQVHQVLMNLCVNARDAMPEGGAIEIVAENVMVDEQYAGMHLEAKAGNYIVLSVSDTGIGIPPKIRERIFEPFFTTKEVGKGTGLGLSTVMAIVKSHGGFVNVYSEVGKGSVFKAYLPAHEIEESRKGKEKEETQLGNGELILVVDDEEAVREITRATLETYGYRVVTAVDGTDAMAQFIERRNEIALVVTDMVMPYMDGAATIRALRKIDPGLGIILVSGLAQNAENASDGQGVAFLPKPYTAHELLQAIRHTLDSAGENRHV